MAKFTGHGRFKEGSKVEVQSRYVPTLWVHGKVSALEESAAHELYEVYTTAGNLALNWVEPQRIRKRQQHPEPTFAVGDAVEVLNGNFWWVDGMRVTQAQNADNGLYEVSDDAGNKWTLEADHLRVPLTEGARALEQHTRALIENESYHGSCLRRRAPYAKQRPDGPVQVGEQVAYDYFTNGTFYEGYTLRKKNPDKTYELADPAGQVVHHVPPNLVRKGGQELREEDVYFTSIAHVLVHDRALCVAEQAHGPDAAPTLDALQSLIETRIQHAPAREGPVTLELTKRLVAGRERLSATTPAQAAKALALQEAVTTRWFASPEATAAFAARRAEAHSFSFSQQYAAGLQALRDAQAGYLHTPATPARQATLDALATEIAAFEAVVACPGDAAAVAALSALMGGPGGFKVGDRVEAYDRDAVGDRWGNGVFTIDTINADGTYYSSGWSNFAGNLDKSEIRLAKE